MRLTILLITVACLKVTAGTYAQSVSVSLKKASLEEVFSTVKQQTGFLFFYDRDMLNGTRPVTIKASNLALPEFLTAVFKDQPLDYSIKNKTIFIKRKPAPSASIVAVIPIPVNGEVKSAEGEALIGVSIRVKGTSTGTVTDVQGKFNIRAEAGQILQVSYVGYETQEVAATSAQFLTIILKPSSSSLDETVVIGYGTAVRRTSTGSVSSVRAKELASQPVLDPLAALQGRIPGLSVMSSNGLPGSSFKVMLRGQNSISGGNEPLYIIDGVPFFSESLNQFTSANGNQSPLAALNIADIERIDVLKDADATAIYGSRGANGVILITTKKGKAGATQFNFNAYTGGSKVVNKIDMLNTEQYVKMRKEAFVNDAQTPDINTAPDLLIWDQAKGTDWQQRLGGNTAEQLQVQGSVSGGNENTRYLLSGTYRKDGTVMPNDNAFKRGSVHMNIDHTSNNGKFSISASVNYSSAKDNSLASDLTMFYDLAPNYPAHNTDGSFYWVGNQQNPEAYLLRRSDVSTSNLIANSVIKYNILKGLDVSVNLGYNKADMDQKQMYPSQVFNPTTSTGSFSYFGNSSIEGYIIEPQINYTKDIAKGKLQLLAGGTFQEKLSQGQSFTAENYSSDALLEDIKSAGQLTARPSLYSFYRYNSVFGRATYNWDERYVLNATFRRDGSTRFGPGKRFGNFGSIGAAWIFSNESFIPEGSVLSFGKLRGSYGTTGNDIIGEYKYLDSWSSTSFPYDNIAGLGPSRLANPDYRWEENRKMEVALELGFFKDRILLTSNYYRNISTNQLVDYQLSPQVGFEYITANFPAKVLNAGWEFELNTVNVDKKNFSWKSSFNLTFNKNELMEYPDFESSAYTQDFAIGKSLTIVHGYQFTGVDPQTGMATFLDIDKNGTIAEFDDYVVLGKTMPDFYSGFSNTFTYKGFELDFLFQFVKQEGPLLNYGRLAGAYGEVRNKDLSALNRWQTPGDIKSIPKAVLVPGNSSFDLYRESTAVWGDASFIRLKNISLRYDLSKFTKGWKLDRVSVFALAQNLFTITSYDGFDPETQGLVMPPMKTITAGLNIAF